MEKFSLKTSFILLIKLYLKKNPLKLKLGLFTGSAKMLIFRNDNFVRSKEFLFGPVNPISSCLHFIKSHQPAISNELFESWNGKG